MVDVDAGMSGLALLQRRRDDGNLTDMGAEPGRAVEEVGKIYFSTLK